MNIIVADTGPLNYLTLIGEIEVLGRLFTTVFVPGAVWKELQHSETPDVVKNWIREALAGYRFERQRSRSACRVCIQVNRKARSNDFAVPTNKAND